MSVTQEFLEAARITDDAEGDLIADMRRDPEIPGLFPSIKAMRAYVASHGASPEALAAVPVVWRRYDRWLCRHPFRCPKGG